MFFYVHQSYRHDSTHPGLFTSWGALPSSGLPSCKQRIAGWLFFFFFFFFPKLFPMVRFEPGTFHSASERLNHSAIPETDYVTPTENFQISNRQNKKKKKKKKRKKEKGMVNCIISYCNFVNLGNICMWPIFDKLSDIKVQILFVKNLTN